MRLSARKPTNPKYPKQLKTLGDHLRARRLDLGLRQGEVAERVGVAASTVVDWERHRTEPRSKSVPAIVKFLGYLPAPTSQAFAEVLRNARRAAGLNQEQLAKRTGVDESSIARWERGETLPFPSMVQRLSRYFRQIGRPLPKFLPEAIYDPERRAEVARTGWQAKKSRGQVPK